MVWLWLYLLVGVLNLTQFSLRHRLSSVIEALFFVLLWPLQLLFAVFAYVIVPVVNWIGERVLP